MQKQQNRVREIRENEPCRCSRSSRWAPIGTWIDPAQTSSPRTRRGSRGLRRPERNSTHQNPKSGAKIWKCSWKKKSGCASPSCTRATASQKKPNADPSCLPPAEAFSYCGGGTCTGGGGGTFTGAAGGENFTGIVGGGLATLCCCGEGAGDGGDGEAAVRGAVAGVEKPDRGDSDGREERGVLAGDGGVMKTVRFPALPIIGGGGGDGEEVDPIPATEEEEEVGFTAGASGPLGRAAAAGSSWESWRRHCRQGGSEAFVRLLGGVNCLFYFIFPISPLRLSFLIPFHPSNNVPLEVTTPWREAACTASTNAPSSRAHRQRHMRTDGPRGVWWTPCRRRPPRGGAFICNFPLFFFLSNSVPFGDGRDGGGPLHRVHWTRVVRGPRDSGMVYADRV